MPETLPVQFDTTLEINRATIRRIYLEVLNRGAVHLAAEVFDPQVVDHRRFPGKPTGLENILEGARLNRLAFPDLQFTLEDVAAEAEMVFARWTMRGTHRGPFMGREATGRPIVWRGITQFHLLDGRVTERWLYADDTALLALIEGA